MDKLAKLKDIEYDLAWRKEHLKDFEYLKRANDYHNYANDCHNNGVTNALNWAIEKIRVEIVEREGKLRRMLK